MSGWCMNTRAFFSWEFRGVGCRRDVLDGKLFVIQVVAGVL